MLKTSRCIALCALILVSFDSLCLAETEPLFYIYHGQPKALTLDAGRIAVRVNPNAPDSHTSAVPNSLVTRGFRDADVVAQPVPGWMILKAQNALTTLRTRGRLASSAGDASSVHALIASLLDSGDATIEFVSPVFRDEAGEPIILTPTLLIGFQKDFSTASRSQLLAAVPEGAEQQKVEFPQPQAQRWQLHSHDGFVALDRANALAQTPGVTYAELDMIVTGHADLVPTDPLFTQSWGLKNTGQSGGQAGFDMEATSAWDITTGSASVIVLILDVGVQQDHPDINQVTGRDFTSDASSNPTGGPFGAYDNHGTWVAGCVSGRINNGLGTAGIAPGVKVASARCYNNGTSTGTFTFQFSWVIDALNWGQSIGARISNNSNYYTVASSSIENTYDIMRANGMVHFASAGNSGVGSISYPSSISSVNSVGAANRFGQRSNFSQYGVGLKYLAPGEQIYTTDRTGNAGGVAGDYELVDGTSFASPYAAGVAALIISQNPGLSVTDVESRMQTSCQDMGPAGYDTDYGYGMVDAFRALAQTITSNLNPPGGQVGTYFAYQISANNNPTNYSATGLPPGLQLDTTSGLISGTPTYGSIYSVTVTAHGAAGDASAVIQIVITAGQITSYLYPSPVQTGDGFVYQIAANNQPTSFSAIDLPPDVVIDPVTGILSGVPSLTGTFHVTIIAHGLNGDAISVLTITVGSPTPLQPKPQGVIKSFNMSVQRMVLDPARSRIYASDQFGRAIFVIDTTTLSVVDTIYVEHLPWGLSLSIDGSTLLVGESEQNISSGGWIGRIDLNSLQILPSFHVFLPISQVFEGLGNRLYAGGLYPVVMVDGQTGNLLGTTGIQDGLLTVSSDRTTLYTADLGSPSTLHEYNISQQASSEIEKTDFDTRGQGGATDLKLSHNQQFLCFACPIGNECLYGATATALMPASDIRSVLGNFVFSTAIVATYLGAEAFSNDDAVFYQAHYDNATMIKSFDVASLAQTGTLTLGGDPANNVLAPSVKAMEVDASNAYLFAATEMLGYAGQLRVYSTGRGTPPVKPIVAHSFLNVSTRTFVQSGDNVEIGGFIILGNQPKRVVLRAMGPSLTGDGLPALADPTLELHNSTGAVVATNDNWNSRRLEVLSTGLAPSDEHEAVIVKTLPPGNYTAVLRGLKGATGTAVFELYDLDPTNSRVANISTRSDVGTGDNVMIGGFIIGGGQPTKVIVRAMGPSLTQFGVSGALADPTLELHDGSGNLITQNDDWRSDQPQAIIDSHFAPSDDRESAILATLPPGNYTAIVRGKNNTTGVAVVEVYNLEPH